MLVLVKVGFELLCIYFVEGAEEQYIYIGNKINILPVALAQWLKLWAVIKGIPVQCHDLACI